MNELVDNFKKVILNYQKKITIGYNFCNAKVIMYNTRLAQLHNILAANNESFK